MIIGTAGRIDHGKTTLVKALTGIAAGIAVGIATELAAADPADAFNPAAFHDQLGNERKVAIQVREWFDAVGITLRAGDARVIQPHHAKRNARCRS